jgi:hypothetical protein
LGILTQAQVHDNTASIVFGLLGTRSDQSMFLDSRFQHQSRLADNDHKTNVMPNEFGETAPGRRTIHAI